MFSITEQEGVTGDNQMAHSDYSELRRERSQNLENCDVCIWVIESWKGKASSERVASNRIGIPLSIYLNCNHHRQRIKCSKSGKVTISKKLWDDVLLAYTNGWKTSLSQTRIRSRLWAPCTCNRSQRSHIQVIETISQQMQSALILSLQKLKTSLFPC